MSRYIDADALKERLIQNIALTNAIDRSFSEAPSIDIVRCKECKHNVGLSNGDGFWEEDIVCGYWDSDGLTAYDFCSFGERREP